MKFGQFAQKLGLELVSLPHFLHDFWKKIYFVTFCLVTKFHFLVAFTSGDIGQYNYCNCFVNQVVTSQILKLILFF